jgi:arylsulfatase A-like enzyme
MRTTLVGLTFFAALAALSQGAAPTDRPNIIFVLADDISAKDLAAYKPDNPYGIKLPMLDKMAKEGVMFQTAWATPLCGPSRAMLHTGKYPCKTGYFENQVSPQTPFWRDPRHALTGRVLQSAGYKNAWYGKIHFGGTPVDYGFDEYCSAQWWDGYDGPHQAPAGRDAAGMYAISWYWHPGLLADGKGVPTTPEDFGPQIESERLLDFITRHKDGPFFVYWPTFLPHMAHKPGMPMAAPGSWFYPDVPECDAQGRPTGKKIPGSLASNMQFLDQKLQLIVKRLEDLGILNNTIIMLAGDNGTPGYGKGRFESEVALRVPFIVWGPGLVKPVGPSPVLVDFTDILPTLAELGGAKIPDDVSGHSFAAYLLGKPFVPRDSIFMQFDNARWLRDPRYLLDGNGRFYDCGEGRDETAGWGDLQVGHPLGSAGPKKPGVGYKDVTKSTEPKVVAARTRFEEISRKFPGPDYEDPATRAAWKSFRKRSQPVKVYQPDYLE